jgi:hypothetical protein
VLAWPQLADQVEMGRALILSSQLCGRPGDLDRASLGRVVIEVRGPRRQPDRRGPEGRRSTAPRGPGKNARAALFFAELEAATGDKAFHEAGRRALDAFAEAQQQPGLAAADWALAQRALLEPETPEAPAWRASASERPETPRVIRFGRRAKR